MKAPIYLHGPDGNVTEISIQEGIEIVNQATNKGYYIENVRRDWGGDITVTADFKLIKFPAHYADALDIAFAARPPKLPDWVNRIEDEPNYAADELRDKIKGFLEAWEVHTEWEGKQIVLRVPGYGERLGTEYGFGRDDDDSQWGKRGAALFGLWNAVQDV